MSEQPDGGHGGLGGRQDGGVAVVADGDTAVEVGCALWLAGRHGVLCIVMDKGYVDFMRWNKTAAQRASWHSVGIRDGVGHIRYPRTKQTGMN